MTDGAELVARGLADILRPLIDEAVTRVRDDLEQSMRHLRPLAVNAAEAGRLLGVSERTVRRLIDDGHLPVVPHLGGRILVPVASIEAYVAAAVGGAA